MSYDDTRGFQSFRIRAAAGARLFVPGSQLWTANVAAAAANSGANPGTLDSMVVELPDTAAADVIEFYDLPNISLVPASTPVLVLRPWGSATQGTYTIVVQRAFQYGIIAHCNTMVTADVNLTYSVGPKLRSQYAR